MSKLIAGLVLPESVLTSRWFGLLATVVAFNTIIYMGLTLSKLIPWPQQFQPQQVRKWLGRVGVEPAEETMKKLPPGQPREMEENYESLRLAAARLDIPRAFALIGMLVMAVGIASTLDHDGEYFAVHLLQFGVALTFLIIGMLFSRGNFRTWTMIWTWAFACIFLVGALLIESEILGSPLLLAQAYIVMTAFAPVLLAWRPTIVGAALMFAEIVALDVINGGEFTFRLLTGAIAALLTSAVLLRLRLIFVDALSDERARSSSLASTDALTGCLSRHGLLTLVPLMAGNAERTNQTVCLIKFEVEKLADANEQYGMGYGDELLKTVAGAINANVRAGDLVSRWSGHSFVVVGLGGEPDADALRHRIEEAVRVSGVALGKWSPSIRVSAIAGDPRETTFERMLAASST